jgi:hypothetical protein
MERMEAIADFTAEIFIKKHFIHLDQTDYLVMVMRSSVREAIKEALSSYASNKG